jgi:AAA family ATP:ADP antiporter
MTTPPTGDSELISVSRSSGRRILRRFGLDIRPGETLSAALFFLFFFLVITFQYATKSVRQSTFIDTLGAAKLPWVYLLVALFSYPLLKVYSAGVNRLRRHHLIAATGIVVAASLVLFRWLYEFPWAWVRVVFYVWVSIIFVMTVSQFWSYANQVYDARQAKRLFGFIGAGGLLGGLAGGQVARVATRLVGTGNSLLVSATIMLSVVGLVFWIHRLHPGVDDSRSATGMEKLGAAQGGGSTVMSSRLLLLIATVLAVTVAVAQVVDLQFNWAVEAATTTLDQRTAFFGNFYSIMSLTAFAFQLLFTARIHRTLGVGVALRVLPVTMALGTGLLFVSAIFMPAILLSAAVVLKVGENGLRYSLDQATRELLYLPVARDVRMKAKAFIDVFVQRGAKGIGALLLLPVTFGLMTALHAGWITLGLIAFWLVALVALRREYVQAFRDGLKERAIDDAMPLNLSDAVTLELLVEALSSPDPRQARHAMQLLRRHDKGHLVPPLMVYHEDAGVRREALDILASVQRREFEPLVRKCLSDPDAGVRAAAVRCLAALTRADIGQLMEPALEDGNPAVRAAAIVALLTDVSARSADQAGAALEALVTDAEPHSRRQAAAALGELPEPMFRESLMRLLYDPDSEVVRAAIRAVQRRCRNSGPEPIYLPVLVAKLGNRRIKHEARDAIVEYGSEAVDALAHFLRDEDEALWVRRALPKTLSRIADERVPGVLLECLEGERDETLRSKLIEAFSTLRESAGGEMERTRLRRQLEVEARSCLQAMADLEALQLSRKGKWVGPRVQWDEGAEEPSLLDRLLQDHLDRSVSNMFGLLATEYERRAVWAVWRSLTDGDKAHRLNALEYLDNLLSPELRKPVQLVVGDAALDDRMREAVTHYGVQHGERAGVLRRLIRAGVSGDEMDMMLAQAAMYVARTAGLDELMEEIERAVDEATDEELAATGHWVLQRWRADRRDGRKHAAGTT